MFEALDWQHGVFTGAAMASETTAAATGAVGQVRRDPMAMKPFCGYNFADYWGYWLGFEKRSTKLPRVFHVNWFRKDDEGRFMWPGFGENMRVLQWILERCQGRAEGLKTPIGYVPDPAGLNVNGLELGPSKLRELLSIDPTTWRTEIDEVEAYFETFGDRLPQALSSTADQVRAALEAQPTTRE